MLTRQKLTAGVSATASFNVLTDRETDRQTDRQRQRHRDRERQRQRTSFIDSLVRVESKHL